MSTPLKSCCFLSPESTYSLSFLSVLIEKPIIRSMNPPATNGIIGHQSCPVCGSFGVDVVVVEVVLADVEVLLVASVVDTVVSTPLAVVVAIVVVVISSSPPSMIIDGS